jgi:hypothetical protein
MGGGGHWEKGEQIKARSLTATSNWKTTWLLVVSLYHLAPGWLQELQCSHLPSDCVSIHARIELIAPHAFPHLHSRLRHPAPSASFGLLATSSSHRKPQAGAQAQRLAPPPYRPWLGAHLVGGKALATQTP